MSNKTKGGQNSLNADGTPRYMPSPEVNAQEPKVVPKTAKKKLEAAEADPSPKPEADPSPKAALLLEPKEPGSKNPLTIAVIKRISARARDRIAEGIVEHQHVLAEFGINEGPRRQMFLAQLAHESDGFKTTREYASGRAYEGRGDLGNVEQGDGTRYRGRGLIQLTGRFNYTKFGNILKVDLVNNPDAAEEFPLALTIAALYWHTHNLNQVADRGDFRTVTRIINGGFNGLADRQHYLKITQGLGL